LIPLPCSQKPLFYPPHSPWQPAERRRNYIHINFKDGIVNSTMLEIGSVQDISLHITILREYIGMEPRLCVDAQQMHQFFCLGHVFRNWFIESLAENGFVSGRDYAPYDKRRTGQGRPAVDYLVSLPMAREMAACLPHNLRAVQCGRYIKEVEASGKLPVRAGVDSVLELVEKKLPPAATPPRPPEPAAVSLPASSIPVIKGKIGGIETLVVDARSLHEFLDVGRHFASWIKGRILNSQYSEGIDYATFDCPRVGNQKPTSGRGGDRKSIGYLLSLNTAKEVAMMERNAQGRAVRNYFIDCEKQLYTRLPAAAPEAPQTVGTNEKPDAGADTRLVAADSIVMSPAEFSGYRAVMSARQNRLALLGGEVFSVNLRATEDKAIAAITTTAFLKVVNPKMNKFMGDLEFDYGTADGLKAMIDAISGWDHRTAA
jgi:phage anti-repressor protein